MQTPNEIAVDPVWFSHPEARGLIERIKANPPEIEHCFDKVSERHVVRVHGRRCPAVRDLRKLVADIGDAVLAHCHRTGDYGPFELWCDTNNIDDFLAGVLSNQTIADPDKRSDMILAALFGGAGERDIAA